MPDEFKITKTNGWPFVDIPCIAWPGGRTIDEKGLLGEKSAVLATSTDSPNDGVFGTLRYQTYQPSKCFRIPHLALLAQSHAANVICIEIAIVVVEVIPL